MNTLSSWYFPWTIKIAGIILLPTAIAIISTSPIIAVVMLVTGLIIFTTHYGVCVDKVTSTYKEYTWFLFLKLGKEINFDHVEYLYIKPNKVSRTYNSRIQSATVTDIEYDAYIKFSETEKIHVTHSKHREQVIVKLRKLKDYLNVPILDYTKAVPEEI
jgi:hypothetical protein